MLWYFTIFRSMWI